MGERGKMPRCAGKTLMSLTWAFCPALLHMATMSIIVRVMRLAALLSLPHITTTETSSSFKFRTLNEHLALQKNTHTYGAPIR